MLSTARRYRIAFSLSFIMRFWSVSTNTNINMTSVDMIKWIVNDVMISKCSLYSHIEKILFTSSKLDYIESVLDVWDDVSDFDELLILSEFVLVIYFAVKVSISFFLFSTHRSAHRLDAFSTTTVTLTNIVLVCKATSF